MGYFEYVETIVEVARICGSIGLSVAAHNSLVYRSYQLLRERTTRRRSG